MEIIETVDERELVNSSLVSTKLQKKALTKPYTHQKNFSPHHLFDAAKRTGNIAC